MFRVIEILNRPNLLPQVVFHLKTDRATMVVVQSR